MIHASLHMFLKFIFVKPSFEAPVVESSCTVIFLIVHERHPEKIIEGQREETQVEEPPSASSSNVGGSVGHREDILLVLGTGYTQ